MGIRIEDQIDIRNYCDTYFIITIPIDAIIDKRLSDASFRVYTYLIYQAEYQTVSGHQKININYINEKLGISPRNLNKVLKELVNLGYLEISENIFMIKLYKVDYNSEKR
jgi:DNA-binding MarR family transcriptional regulator